MLFVDKCLPDEKWPQFYPMAVKIGLDKLAVVTTRMCEKYLALGPHSWCEGADEKLCDQLMEYVMSCGNFGLKRAEEDGPGANILAYARTPAAMMRLLQERGLVNWAAARKYKCLAPFAWIYQLGRYMKNGLGRDNAVGKLTVEAETAKEKVLLLDALGVRQASKRLAIYKNGKYVRTRKMP